jgi:hypothetical protein
MKTKDRLSTGGGKAGMLQKTKKLHVKGGNTIENKGI